MKSISSVECTVSGLSAEKLLNAARQKGITLERIKRKKNRALFVRCGYRDYAILRALGEEWGYQIGEARPVGALRAAKWLGRRTGLWLGALIGALLLTFSLGFVWQVRIENAGPYQGEVRAYLEELGIRPGRRRADIDIAELRDRLEWRLPQVKWVRVEWAGVALRVRLENGTPSPEIESVGKAGDVVASEDGVIRQLTAFAGTPLVKVGDLVREGQVLIRGEERGENGEMIPVKARGEAAARVWVSVNVRLPVTDLRSVPTGRETKEWGLWTPFFTWKRKEAPEYLTFDREETRVPLGGAWLPAALLQERYVEVELEKTQRNIEEVKREGEKAAVFALNQALISDEIVDKWIKFYKLKILDTRKTVKPL